MLQDDAPRAAAGTVLELQGEGAAWAYWKDAGFAIVPGSEVQSAAAAAVVGPVVAGRPGCHTVSVIAPSPCRPQPVDAGVPSRPAAVVFLPARGTVSSS